MDAFHSDFQGFTQEFKEEAEKTAALMFALSEKLGDYFAKGFTIKELYDMAGDLRYGAEKAYRVSHNIQDDEETYFSNERLKKIVREQMIESLKEFCLNKESVLGAEELDVETEVKEEDDK